MEFRLGLKGAQVTGKDACLVSNVCHGRGLGAVFTSLIAASQGIPALTLGLLPCFSICIINFRVRPRESKSPSVLLQHFVHALLADRCHSPAWGYLEGWHVIYFWVPGI